MTERSGTADRFGNAALLPLLVGMCWMLGAMAWLGLRLNFFNIFVLTMVVGIGVASRALLIGSIRTFLRAWPTGERTGAEQPARLGSAVSASRTR